MPEQVHSVAEITGRIRESLEGDFSEVWIEGEVSNHRLPGSGHHYFTLKDPFAQLACVLFKGAAGRSPVRLTDGMQVKVFGSISVYEARGQYQLIAQIVQPKGLGDLQAQFEALKNRLGAEGLFASENKKRIPSFPETLGIVTSPTGAAIRDIINVLSRRAPWIRVMVYPVRVQGEGAAGEIASAVRAFDEARGIPRPDLLIVSRGGGSIEDLWAFNEEVVARAIAECSIPVMTGVGHEIDFTIADFVADRREPTPSAAAENAVPDGVTLRRHLERLTGSLDSQTGHAFELFDRHCRSLKRELEAREPGRRIQGWIQSLDYLSERMESVLSARISQSQGDLNNAGRRMEALQPDRELSRLSEISERLLQSIEQSIKRAVSSQEQKLAGLQSLLQSLSPESVLKRGFSLVTNDAGKVVTSAGQVKSGDLLQIRVFDGVISSRVDP